MNTKLCEFCGKAIPANSQICPYCNKALNNKVFSFDFQDTASQRGKLDVSKYTDNSDTKVAENYFDSNIYSVSQEEIEKRYEKKDVVYDEEERIAQNEQYRHQRDKLPTKQRYQRKKKKNNQKLIVIGVAVLVILLIIIIAAFSGKNSTDEVKTQKTTVKTTQTQTTEATTETTTETTTMPTIAFSSSCTDVYGYLNVNFNSVSDDFGDQTGEATSDSEYGGSIYHYDGMTVSTDSTGLIKRINCDYVNAENKALYWFTNKISYCATQDTVNEAMSDFELTSSDDVSLTYLLDSGSNQYIKFTFDTNKQINGFETSVVQ